MGAAAAAAAHRCRCRPVRVSDQVTRIVCYLRGGTCVYRAWLCFAWLCLACSLPGSSSVRAAAADDDEEAAAKLKQSDGARRLSFFPVPSRPCRNPLGGGRRRRRESSSSLNPAQTTTTAASRHRSAGRRGQSISHRVCCWRAASQPTAKQCGIL